MFVREGFYIGTYLVHWYGFLVIGGAIMAAVVADFEARRRGFNREMVWDAFPWLIIAGVIGARIWHILTPPASMVAQGITPIYYLTHPLDAIMIWKGGLGIPGAVMGGVIALYFYCRQNKINFLSFTDIAAPGLALAQAIGRWGNFLNQELYGAPTDLPWKLFVEPQYRLPGYENAAYYHPLFLYESIYNLLNMAFLLWAARRFGDRLKPGDIFFMYMIIYPVGRFFLEFLRLDPSNLANLNINQLVMVIVAVAGVVLILIRHRKTSTQA